MGIAAGIAAVGVATAVANDAGAFGGGSSGTSGGGNSPQQNTQQTQYNFYGPHVSTSPLSNEEGSKATNSNVTTPINGKVTEAKSVNAEQEPAARDSKTGTGANDYEASWGNRLSHYLDYNSRQLG